MRYLWIKKQREDQQEWLMQRNCRLTPRQLLALFCLAGFFSVSIAGAWASQGFWWVLPFALIEVLGLSIAFVVYSRHAVDFDRVRVAKDRVFVEVVDGAKQAIVEASASSVRVVCDKAGRGLIQLRMGSQQVEVGRFVPAGQRLELAEELAGALGVRVH